MNTPTGFLAPAWRELLREVEYKIDRKYLLRTVQVTIFSYFNSHYFKKELQIINSQEFKRIEVKEPIFILGHWRNGTTLLHELFALDQQFAYPNLFENSRPNTFLVREPLIEEQAKQMPASKRPMDNMMIQYTSPGEDESALSVMSLRSPMISWMFPRFEDRYDQYLTFKGTPDRDIERWKKAIVLYMKKLTYKYNRPLVMKSPTHTAKIKILLELFPDARFIHIHREPYTVFQSTIKLYNTAVQDANLQNPLSGSLNAGILRRYQKMYEAFFEQRRLIPDDHYVEIAFEELDANKLGVLRDLYARLDIPGFEQAQPEFENYLKRTADYKKNQYNPIPEPLRSEIAHTWQCSFDEWDYPR
jgi:omega-hydroxy-beta-dihydromenaquinone-9 sulfotransferase